MPTQTLLRLACALGTAALLAVSNVGCADVNVIAPADQIGGQTAVQSKVRLARSYEGKVRLTRMVLPAGDYLPVFRDDDGVYYQSPAKLVIKPYILPGVTERGRVYDGGIYLETENLGEPKVYTINGLGSQQGEVGRAIFANRPVVADLPKDFVYELVKR